MAITGMFSYMSASTSTIFSTAGQNISAQVLDQELRRQIMQMERMSNQRIDMKLAVQMGILNQVISNMSLRLLLDKVAQDSGITIRRDRIEAMIRAYPEMQDAQGNFNYQMFRAMLQASNISETDFVEETRKEKARELIQSSFMNMPNIPKFLAKFDYMANNEIRNVSSILMNAKDTILTEKPTDEELLQIYEGRKSNFKTPEYRTVSYVLITPDNVSKFKKIAKNDEANLSSAMYDVAENITDDLISGETFADIKKKYGVQTTTLPKFDLIGNGTNKKAVGDKVFTDAFIEQAKKMSKNDVSGIENSGSSNLMIFQITELEEATQKPFADVKSEIVSIWEMNKREDKTLERISEIKRNMMENKKSLTDVAKEYGLKTYSTSLKQTDKSLPIETVQQLFASKIGTVNIKKESSVGLYRVFVIDNIDFPT
jgi:peptidyl-prolyl cis-trans isomerase D